MLRKLKILLLLRLIAEARAQFGNYLDSYFLEIMACQAAGKLADANTACAAYFERPE